ncbi:hypothetical protein BDN67DRAFT_1004877 [Paxillus ammoniavirescens]|nr:hypothetical protein BDN67DRAFT_1004877 [Paxillus ammoniavirescens]
MIEMPQGDAPDYRVREEHVCLLQRELGGVTAGDFTLDTPDRQALEHQAGHDDEGLLLVRIEPPQLSNGLEAVTMRGRGVHPIPPRSTRTQITEPSSRNVTEVWGCSAPLTPLLRELARRSRQHLRCNETVVATSGGLGNNEVTAAARRRLQVAIACQSTLLLAKIVWYLGALDPWHSHRTHWAIINVAQIPVCGVQIISTVMSHTALNSKRYTKTPKDSKRVATLTLQSLVVTRSASTAAHREITCTRSSRSTSEPGQVPRRVGSPRQGVVGTPSDPPELAECELEEVAPPESRIQEILNSPRGLRMDRPTRRNQWSPMYTRSDVQPFSVMEA